MEELYGDDYFSERNFQDKKRLKSFEQERDFISKYISSGTVCDVGCSTGEFLTYINWNGNKYGMEINESAIETAKTRGFNFEKNILTETDFFDIVIFRGTIQHLEEPFSFINRAFSSLKSGGYIVFLATPNANSRYYKLFNTLPMLDAPRNFYIPSDITLSDILKNSGFKVLEIDKPYLSSPYSSPVKDHLKFIKKSIFKTDDKFPFWGNMMNLIAVKDK
jgi:SAM-dependent methyltransferase